MKISVAFIVYNGAKYFRTQLDSILDQTLNVNEIIVYDTMKKTYSKLNITLEKLRNIINNKEIVNDCKYEFYQV